MEQENNTKVTKESGQESNTNIIAIIAIVIAIVSLFMSISNRQALSNGVAITGGADVFYEASAKKAGIRSKTFETCLADTETTQKVRDDINEAIAAGGQGTPFSVLITPTGAQIPISGALPAELFNQVIVLLESQDSESTKSLNALFTKITEGKYTVVPELADSSLRLFDPAIDHYKGSENPRYTLIEYSDFECPYCAQAHRNFEQLISMRDDVTWVYRHFPLESIHPNAEPAARASECIAELKGNDAFWDFADTIFADQGVLQK